MKTTFISKENNDAKFEMEFTGEEFEEAIQKVYQETKDRFRVDGFRKGKAPRSIIEKRYGEHIFEDDAINNLFSDKYMEAVTELGLKVINSPRAEFQTVSREEGLKVVITVECYPEVDVKDYKGVEIERRVAEVTDDDINTELDTLRKRNARIENVERPIKDGDHIILDFDGSVDGVPFDGGKADSYSLVIGSGTFIPGFEEQLIGVEPGGEKDVVVTFPEDYGAEDLAGKEAVFKCKVHEVKEEELPELDDDFAKDVSEFDTLEELKKDTAEKLQDEKNKRAENMMKDAAIKAVYEANDIYVPRPLVEDELDNMIDTLKQRIAQQGVDFDTYLGYIDKKESDMREDMKEEAERNVKTRMLVAAVVDKENITADDADLDKQVEDMAKQYNMEADKIREMLGEDNLQFMKKDLEMQKAVDFIFDNAVIKEPEEKAEEKAEEAPAEETKED
ncbi:MAG: trigger factor [Bacillota bacterium]|nr:trigger factor [Bacillota bacterium]MDO4859693.1 trigger factor [Bacillota bacterium]